MIIKKIVQIGDPRIRVKSKKINPTSKIAKRAVKDLTDTMRSKSLVGISAPQIGRSYRIILAEIRPKGTLTRQDYAATPLKILINPKIIKYSKKKKMIYEGCGSVAYGQIFGPVTRPDKITVEAYDTKGKKFKLTTDGLLSTIVQHEYDHLEGVVFTDKLTDVTKLMSLDEYIAARKADKIP